MESSNADSVVMAISQLSRGNRDSVELLVRRYMRRLSGLAATRLRGRPELKGYSEDVAISTIKSVCMRVERGSITPMNDRDQLWRLLATITIRKAISLIRGHSASVQASDFQWSHFSVNAPDPKELFEMTTQVERLFSILDDDEMRSIARWKVDGHSNNEVAGKLKCTERTIERRLHRIRAIWKKEFAEST